MQVQSKKRLVYDAELKRPGCAILQAAFGCNPRLANEFDSKTWLLAPTPNMKVYAVTDQELGFLVRLSDKAQQKVA